MQKDEEWQFLMCLCVWDRASACATNYKKCRSKGESSLIHLENWLDHLFGPTLAEISQQDTKQECKPKYVWIVTRALSAKACIANIFFSITYLCIHSCAKTIVKLVPIELRATINFCQRVGIKNWKLLRA